MRLFKVVIFKILRFYVLSIVFLFIISCSSKNRLEGHIYYRLGSNPTTLDPAFIVDVTGGLISAKIFNGLVKLDNKLEISPDIAKRWEILDNGKTYFFYLRKGVKFSNNQEVTASDFKYSFERIMHPETRSPNTWVFDKVYGAKAFMKGLSTNIRGIEVKDRYTLMIKLERPFSPFLYLLTMSAAYVVPEEEVKRLGPEFSSHPVGTGPFLFREWRHGSELILIRNESYFGEKAKIKGIVYRIIPEDITAISEFEIGNLDIITIPGNEFARYKKSEKWRSLISSINGLNTYYLGFNCSRPPFDDAKIRRALSCSIDREKILNTFFEKRGRLAYGPIPDALRKWKIESNYQYDPVLARKIIKEEGLQGRTVNFYVTSDQEVVDIAEIIQSYIKATGIDVRIKQLEWSAYKEAVNKGEPEIFWLSWWADYPDPENFLFPLFHSSNYGPAGNRTRYRNKEVDMLIETGQSASNRAEANKYYKKAEDIIISEAPWLPFWHRTDFILKQPYVKNFSIYPVYSMDKGTEVSF